MLQITRKSQIFSPGADFLISSFSAENRSRIGTIFGQSLQGALVSWKPRDTFSALGSLRANRPYMIESIILAGSTFEPYELPIDPSGHPGHDDRIVNPNQFFTYRGSENFPLSDLSPDVKSRIVQIYSEGATASGAFGLWRPLAPFSTLRNFVPGRSYLVQSVVSGFSAYNLGIAEHMPLAFLNDALLPDIGLLPAEYIGA
jgi:hypothetical protein